ncbi:MAG TPA: RlmE family RNA methyltransferase [Pseudomonadota bacterium]|nr:RlmE family RNA methyltransferase [Pseudomonadota bacterium]
MGSTAVLKDRRGRHDAFFHKAQQQRFAARAVYKLQEIDERHGVLSAGARVLDLGCRPGSWLQYAEKKVGARGALVGLDRQPVVVSLKNARLLVGDVFQITPQELRGDLAGFDVILSDMAPDTTGIRHVDQARSEGLFERALDLADELLVPGGHFLGKLFQGPDFLRLRERLRNGFSDVRVCKPEGSRKESYELYLLGLRKK